MTARIRLTLPTPPSANSYWTSAPGRGLVPTDIAKEYKAKVAELTRSTVSAPLVGEVTWVGTWYRARRSGDLGNRLKVLEDALNEWAFLDDAQIVAYDWRRSDEEPEAPRVELLLVGDAFASPRQMAEHRHAREQAAQKRRATTRMNRKLKELRGLGIEVTPALRSKLRPR
jgi:crossover junction endodeoxyribonuclease RusA